MILELWVGKNGLTPIALLSATQTRQRYRNPSSGPPANYSPLIEHSCDYAQVRTPDVTFTDTRYQNTVTVATRNLSITLVVRVEQ